MFFSKKTEILVKTIIVKLQVERKLKKRCEMSHRDCEVAKCGAANCPDTIAHE